MEIESQLCKAVRNTDYNTKHYTIFQIDSDRGMELLRSIFPDGKANEMNLVLFSTSGVHGTYTTIRDIKRRKKGGDLTVIILMPRLVSLYYGDIKVEPEDIGFLKELRRTSREVFKSIG